MQPTVPKLNIHSNPSSQPVHAKLLHSKTTPYPPPNPSVAQSPRERFISQPSSSSPMTSPRERLSSLPTSPTSPRVQQISGAATGNTNSPRGIHVYNQQISPRQNQQDTSSNAAPLSQPVQRAQLQYSLTNPNSNSNNPNANPKSPRQMQQNRPAMVPSGKGGLASSGGPNNPNANQPENSPVFWDKLQVQQWLREIEFDEFGANLKYSDGQALLVLGRQELMEMGIPSQAAIPLATQIENLKRSFNIRNT